MITTELFKASKNLDFTNADEFWKNSSSSSSHSQGTNSIWKSYLSFNLWSAGENANIVTLSYNVSVKLPKLRHNYEKN